MTRSNLYVVGSLHGLTSVSFFSAQNCYVLPICAWVHRVALRHSSDIMGRASMEFQGVGKRHKFIGRTSQSCHPLRAVRLHSKRMLRTFIQISSPQRQWVGQRRLDLG